MVILQKNVILLYGQAVLTIWMTKRRRTRIFPWLTSTDPHDCISKGKTSHPYILQTL